MTSLDALPFLQIKYCKSEVKKLYSVTAKDFMTSLMLIRKIAYASGLSAIIKSEKVMLTQI